jgi:hypothetical protein
MVPIDEDGVPGVLYPVAPGVVPEPLMLGLVAGLLLVDPGVPVPIPLELLPVCCASTRGAVTKTTARVDMTVLLSLLVIGIFSYSRHVTLIS